MGVRIIDDEAGVAFLYDGCSMRPVNTEAFASSEEAESFVLLAKKHGVNVAAADAETLDKLHEELRALPKCEDCEQRIVHPGSRLELCADCSTMAEYDAGVEAELGR